MTHNQETSQSTDTDPQIRRMMELADKDAEAGITNTLHTLRTVEEIMNTMRRKMEDFKNQMELIKRETEYPK